MKKQEVKNIALAGMFLAAGMILPFFTGQIKEFGNSLLPMHFPVLMCGLMCGWKYGTATGLLLPLLRSACFGMPILYPSAISMAFELGAYGFIIGLLYSLFRRKNVLSVYGSLIPAMLGGRILWGISQTALLGLSEKGFSLHAFWAGAFLKSIPGIVLQLILIPALTLLTNSAKNTSKNLNT